MEAGSVPFAKAFVCYAHEDAGHEAAVHEFATFLRAQGIDVALDIWAEGDRRDWDLWMRREITGSDFVVVIASKLVRRIGDGVEEGGSRGLRPELDLLRELHREAEWHKRILPVMLPGRSQAEIPLFLLPRNADHYVVTDFSVAGATALLRVLTKQTAGSRPALGSRPVLPPEVARHWVVSARGTDLSPTEFWFTGRRRALDEIREFTHRRQTGLLVVTGMPGAGKSAVLGICVLRSLAPEMLPPEVVGSTPNCLVDVAVHARGKDADTVLSEIASRLGGAFGSADDVRDVLDAIIAKRPAVPVCVIDAVDEAEDPMGVADAARWLSGRVVVLIGVRPDAPAEVGGASRLPPLLEVRHPVVIDLDAREHAAARDVATYVARRLRGDTERPDGYGTGAWDMDVLVDVIGTEIHDDVAVGNFLIAQLVVEEMLDMPVLANRRPGWSFGLHWPRQLRDWIHRDVRRRWGKTGGSRAQSTLAPVAHTLRGGLSLDLWRVLVPLFGTSGSPDKAIGQVLRRLGFYLTSPAPDRYALRHEQFADYFAAALPPRRGDQIFVDVLIDGVPRTEDGRLDWAAADEYTALNLLAHAYAGGELGSVIGDHPACLARVDRLSAVNLLGSATEPSCQAAADALRRAAYESSTEYGRRAAVLQTHAALVGHDDLAAALLAQAGTVMPWTVRWSAGAPDRSPVAIGAAERCQSVTIVADALDGSPSLVLAFSDGTCSLRAAAGGDKLAPDIVVRPIGEEAPPLMRAWHTSDGVVQLAVGLPDGHVTVWTLTGGAAGEMNWQYRVGPDLRDLARVAGPRGTDLLVCLAGGEVVVAPLRPFATAEVAPLLRATCPASRVLALEQTDGFAAFITAGADTDVEAWRIGSGPTVESHVHRGLRADAVVAGGNADQAWVLSNTDQIRATWLSAGLSTAEPPQRLSDGGRTARAALAVRDGRATVAVGDGNGGVQVFRLAPDTPATVISEHDTDHPVYDLAFIDREATMLAVGGWSGDVTVLNVHRPDLSGPVRIHHGEPSVEVLPLGGTDDATLLLTRGISGLTRVWQLPLAIAPPELAQSPVTSLTSVPIDERWTLLAAASAGQETVQCWLVDGVEQRAEPLQAMTHPGGVAALSGSRGGGRARLLSAGEAGVILWAVTKDTIRAQAEFPADRSDIEHAVLGVGPNGHLILGTAGPEHLRLWTEQGDDLVSDEVWVTALASEQIGDRLLVAVGDDDGVVRLLEFGRGDPPTICTAFEGDPVAAVAVLVGGPEVVVAVADRYGGLHVVPAGGIDDVPWQLSHLVPVLGTSGERLFGVASAPPRLLSWLADGDHFRLDTTALGELRGMPLHVAHTGSAIAVADGGGRLLLADTTGAGMTAADLNITVEALTGLAGSTMFVAARGGRLICIAPTSGDSS